MPVRSFALPNAFYVSKLVIYNMYIFLTFLADLMDHLIHSEIVNLSVCNQNECYRPIHLHIFLPPHIFTINGKQEA